MSDKTALPEDMDIECIALCEAMNRLPGIKTTSSCCGHGREKFNIWFKADSLEALPPLLYWFDACHMGIYGWKVYVTTDCAMSPATFCVESSCKGIKAYADAAEIADVIAEEAESKVAP